MTTKNKSNTIIVDGIKYVKIYYDYKYKKSSLNSHTYYTLIDISYYVNDFDIWL